MSKIYVIIPTIEQERMKKWELVRKFISAEFPLRLIAGNTEKQFMKHIVFSENPSGRTSKKIEYYTLSSNARHNLIRPVLDNFIRNRTMDLFKKRSFASSHKGQVDVDDNFRFEPYDIIMIVSRIETQIAEDEKFRLTTFIVE